MMSKLVRSSLICSVHVIIYWILVSGDLILPKGTIVSLSSYSTHYSCDLYSNPSTFNPENFNQENIAKRHKNSFMAFSGGARNCIGKKKLQWIIQTVFLAVKTFFSLKKLSAKNQHFSNGFNDSLMPRRRPSLISDVFHLCNAHSL